MHYPIADPSVIPIPKLAILGEVLIENDLPVAVDLLTKYQSAHPRDFWANYLLAEALTASNDVREIEFRHNALNLRPQSAVVRFLLAMAYRRQVRGSLDEDKLRLAKPHFAAAIRMNRTLWDQLDDDLRAIWPQIESLDR